MFLASSGMLPDALWRVMRKARTVARKIISCAARWLAICQPERAECSRSPNDKPLLTRSGYWDDEFAVLLRHEIFGVAG